jgi:serine/threonine-protein kinase
VTTPAPTSGSLINSFLGPYLLVEKIAEGGTANIYLAHSSGTERTRRHVAKVLKPQLAIDREYVANLRREYETLARLTLEGIPRVFRFDEVARLPGFIMEYIEGTNIYRLLRQGVPFPRLVILLNMIALTARLHRAGIIHNDLKPENFILTPTTGRLNLIDFGNIKQPSRRGITTIFQSRTIKRVRGTPAYMAPELLQRKRPSFASDVYALGACAHHLLTNHPIRSRQQAVDVALQTRQSEEIRLQVPELPREANELLTRCLRQDPESRPENADTLLTILRNAIPPAMLAGRCVLSERLAEQAREAHLAAVDGSPAASPRD